MRFAFIVVLLLLLVAQPVFAGVGLSPADINLRQMVRGGYAERYFTVSNPSEDAQDVSIGVEGDIAGWIAVEPGSFTLEPYSYGVFKATVQPPNDTANGGYSGILMVVSKPHVSQEVGQTNGIAVSSGVAATISVEVSDFQILRYNIEGMSLPDTEECRPIILSINLRNTGNVRVDPRFVITITGPDGTQVLRREEKTATVMPTVATAVTLRLPYQLSQFGCIPQGRYRAEITSYAGDSVMDQSTIYFNVFPRGQLALSGELIELVMPLNVTLGDTARIDAVFKNTGQLPVSAKPVIEVLNGPSLVDTVTGDAKDIGISGIDRLTAYWKPGMPGKYTVRATATFEGHDTAPIEGQLEVLAPAWWFIVGAAAGIAIVVIGFIFLRRGNRKKKIVRKKKR